MKTLSPRRAAEITGELTYVTEKPCKWGHTAPRRTYNGLCTACQAAYTIRGRAYARRSLGPPVK